MPERLPSYSMQGTTYTHFTEEDNTAMRRAERAWWLSILTIAGTLLWSITVLAQESIGQVAALQGQATVQRAGSTQSMPLRIENPVYRDDTIQTLEAAKIKLVLIDGTELVLGERGMMTLSQFVFAPQRQTHRGVVNIARGIFRAVTRKVLPQTAFEVRTGTAVAGPSPGRWPRSPRSSWPTSRPPAW